MGSTAGEKVRRAAEKGRRIWQIFSENRCTTIAGTLVFFLVLSIVPFFFWLTLLFGSGPLQSLEETELLGWARDLVVFLRENAAAAGRGTGLLFLATTLWSSTGFFYHLRRSGEMIYGHRRGKHGWKVRLAALGATFAVLAFFALAGGILFVAGIASDFLPVWLSSLCRIGLTLAINFFGAWLLNSYICPDPIPPSRTARGSFYTALAWLAAWTLFAVYLRLGSHERLYGALTLVILLLLWLYWTMICFVAGAVYNKTRRPPSDS